MQIKGILTTMSFLGLAILSPGLDAGEWENTPVAGDAKETFSANGITGTVGYLTGESEAPGESKGTYGTSVKGTIGETPGSDNKTKDNTLEQKWVWKPEDPENPQNDLHSAGTVMAKLTQDPIGSGASVVETLPGTPEEPGQEGYLASSYVPKVHSITPVPAAGVQHENAQLSLSYRLDDTDTYAVSEVLSNWKREITVQQTDNTVSLTAVSRATAILEGELVTVDDAVPPTPGPATVQLALSLTVPEPAE
jgi:hypothetical protein